MGVIPGERFVAKVSDGWLLFLKSGGFLLKCVGGRDFFVCQNCGCLEVDVMLLIANSAFLGVSVGWTPKKVEMLQSMIFGDL